MCVHMCVCVCVCNDNDTLMSKGINLEIRNMFPVPPSTEKWFLLCIASVSCVDVLVANTRKAGCFSAYSIRMYPCYIGAR
jgi:hypothetical protein